MKDIKLPRTAGVELQPTDVRGVCRATVTDAEKRFDLTWDRFARLYRTAEALRSRVKASSRIIDVGGFDGALAMFLSDYQIDVIDPITTGGTGLGIAPNSYDVVISIDALEHVTPEDRNSFLNRLGDAAIRWFFINFPSMHTAAEQKLLLELTDNPLIREHVEWALPDAGEVKRVLETAGFSVEVQQHSSVSQWVSQYLLQTVAPDVAEKANQFLLKNHMEEPTGKHLYDLLIGRR